MSKQNENFKGQLHKLYVCAVNFSVIISWPDLNQVKIAASVQGFFREAFCDREQSANKQSDCSFYQLLFWLVPKWNDRVSQFH
jgi:hypothetical protein